ncbi:MAG TPA: CPBP family intramembrane glutamic endopeptidase [Myxococcaceae bacterium]|nr:CPBP family intramembrane glutamic endopeptidase [Myxococcaceae bacterium]
MRNGLFPAVLHNVGLGTLVGILLPLVTMPLARLFTPTGPPTHVTSAWLLWNVIQAPIEELIFRGGIQNLLGLIHPALGVLGGALTFGLAHGRTWLPALTGGIVYGILYWRTRSLVTPIAAHLANNTLLIAWALLGSRWQGI